MPHLATLVLLYISGYAWGNAILGAGTALPAQLFADAQFAYRFTDPTMELQYYPSESQAGVCRIESAAAECDPSDTRAPNSLDFASSMGPLNQSDYDDYPDIQLYPVLATAIVPVYNLKGVQGLILSTTVLSQIFSGQISTWDDSRIKTLNPNFTTWKVPANQSIQLVVRQESNDVTMAFKTALLDFSKTFSNYVEVSARPSWGNLTNPTKVTGAEALLSYVLQTPWTISYAALKHAVAANATQVTMSKSGSVTVQASLDATTFAVLETGSNFGNRKSGSGSGSGSYNNGNGNGGSSNYNNYNKTQAVPSRLYADLSNAKGDNAWPIVAYVFVVLRKSTLRSGGTCDTVRNVVAFWYWFLTASVIDNIAQDHYFARPAEVVRNLVVNRLITDVTCNGQLVFQAQQSFPVMAAGQVSVGPVLQQLAAVYTIDLPQVSFGYTSAALNTSDAVAAALGANQFVAVRQPGLAPASGAATLLFAGVALVVVSQYDLVLDVPTLVRILEGDIQTWLHPDLLALNPNGIQNSTGDPINNVTQRIVLLDGPASSSASLQSLLKKSAPNFVGKALQAAQRLSSDDQLRTVVAGTPFTLALTTSSGAFSPLIRFASLQRSAGVAVAPTPAAVLACAAATPSSPTTGLDLSASSAAGCYPLADTVYLVVQTPECRDADSVDEEAVAFVSWMLQDNGTALALEGEGVALLATISPAVRAANTLALSTLSCATPATNTSTDSTDIVPIVAGACVGAFCFIAILVGFFAWKSTRDMRALRKKFSDVQVAEDCAEAIACLDLEAVSWLSTLAKPSKIQLAFLRIVNMLVEVKPFIPDQLLAQLQAVKCGDDEPPHSGRRPHNRLPRKDTADDQTVATSQSHSSLQSSLTSSGPSMVYTATDSKTDGRQSTTVSDGSSGLRRGGRGARVAPTTSLPGSQSVDRLRRTCTYMYVRFALCGDAEDDRLGQRATALAAHVVTVAKGHGATIDKVTYDSVALHWNVAGPCASAPLQATALALELACAAQILPPEAQADLRLLIGIGHGPCTVATVSAAGQRFFVVGGPEVSNAVEVVVRELAVPVGCTVLLSNSVQQEVKYGFRCSPRLWYRDVLFWEPVQQRAGCGLDDEWMYQIQRIEETDASLDVTRALHDVFQLAHTTQSLGVLQREVRQMYAADLSPQDLASLRLLQDTFGGHSRTMVVSAV